MAAQPARGQDDPLLPPIHLTGLFVHAWRIYRRGAGRWIVTYFAVFLPWYVAQSLIAGSVLVGAADRLSGAAIALVGMFIVPALLGSLASDVLAPPMAGTLVGRDVSIAEGLRSIRPSLLELATAGLLAGAVSTFLILPPLSFLYLVGGGLTVGLFFGPPLVAHAMVLERRRLRDAVARAATLARGSWLRILAYVLAVMLIVAIVHVFVIVVVTSLIPFERLLESPVAIGLYAAFAAAFLPYLAAAWVVVYLDLRSRREGLERAGFAGELDQVVSRQPGLTGP